METDTKRRMRESENEKTNRMLNGMAQQFFDGHKEFKPMLINILRGLDLVPVYSIYVSSARMRGFFKDNDVWYILWRTWYPAHEEMTKSIQSIVPHGKRINYLWAMLAHHIASNGFREFYKSILGKAAGEKFYINYYYNNNESIIIKIYQVVVYDKTTDFGTVDRYVMFDFSDRGSKFEYIVAHVIIKNFGRQKMRDESKAIKVDYSHESLMKTVYEFMITFPGATINTIEDSDNGRKIFSVRSQIK